MSWISGHRNRSNTDPKTIPKSIPNQQHIEFKLIQNRFQNDSHTTPTIDPNSVTQTNNKVQIHGVSKINTLDRFEPTKQHPSVTQTNSKVQIPGESRKKYLPVHEQLHLIPSYSSKISARNVNANINDSRKYIIQQFENKIQIGQCLKTTVFSMEAIHGMMDNGQWIMAIKLQFHF
jgi:hypothetical protein